MFGYVRPYVSEMKIREYEKYRAAYCGLCRAMGRVTGQISRLTLSYDLVFLAAVRMVLEGVDPEFEEFRCPAHAAKKRLVMKNNALLEYTAAFSAVLAEAKNADDRDDESGLKKCLAGVYSPMLRHMAYRGGRHLPDNAADGMAQALEKLACLEREKCPSADQTAAAFGETLAYAFSLGLDGEKRELADAIGRSVGRFIYICDAVDDMSADIKHKRYNPLVIGWGDLAFTDGKVSELVRESVMTSTLIDLETLGKAADALDESHVMTPIIKNIVYLGLPASMKRVLYGVSDEEDGRRRKDWILHS